MPGYGLVGCAAPCLCYRFLSFEWCKGARKKDVFTGNDTMSLDMEMQMIKIIRNESLSDMRESQRGDADCHLRAIEMKTLDRDQGSIENQVVYVRVRVRAGI